MEELSQDTFASTKEGSVGKNQNADVKGEVAVNVSTICHSGATQTLKN